MERSPICTVTRPSEPVVALERGEAVYHVRVGDRVVASHRGLEDALAAFRHYAGGFGQEREDWEPRPGTYYDGRTL
jgi:hypothetical protein